MQGNKLGVVRFSQFITAADDVAPPYKLSRPSGDGHSGRTATAEPMMKRVLVAVAVAAAHSGFTLAFQPQCARLSQLSSTPTCVSSRARRTAHSALDVSMGLRDKAKRAIGTVAAGLTFALSSPSGADARSGSPRLVLPSQEAFLRQDPTLLNTDPFPIRFAKSPIFAGTIAISTAAYVSHVASKKVLAEFPSHPSFPPPVLHVLSSRFVSCTCLYVCLVACLCTCVCLCVRAQTTKHYTMHTHTHTQKYLTHTHTHTHTQTNTRSCA